MRYIMATVVAFIVFAIMAAGISLGFSSLWADLAQEPVDPTVNDEYLNSLLETGVIEVLAYSPAAIVAGFLFARIGKASRSGWLLGIIFSAVFAFGVAANQNTVELAVVCGVVVALFSLTGARLGIENALQYAD